MNPFRFFLSLLLFILLGVRLTSAQVIISEVMQSNVELLDEENDLPTSWVELYNQGNKTVQLKDYTFQQGNHRYTIPIDTTLPAHSFLLLYGDDKKGGLHLGFNLPFEEGSLLRLMDNKGVVVDTLLLPPMVQVAVSYGVSNDAKGWLLDSSPNTKNSILSSGYISSPILGHEGGVCHEPITLNLVNHSEGEVRFTMDGTIPSEDSPVFEGGMVIDTTTVIRMRRFKDGFIPSEVSSYSYLFPDHEMTLPVVSVITDPASLYDPYIGIYEVGTYDSTHSNYQYDWHRSVHIDYFTVDGLNPIHQLAEMRIAGATSRKLPLKSLSFYSKKRLSGGDFEYPFWKSKPHVEQVHSFLLRNAGNDFLYAHLRDAAAQTYAGKHIKNIDYQAYQPVVLYLNGEYKGLLNLRERTNADYIYANYPEVKEVDVVENWNKVNSGDEQEALKFYQLFTDPEVTYQQLAEAMDIEEFINLFIVEAYFGNVDFPDNNIVMWRERKEGAKWRWILKDLDMTSDYRLNRQNLDEQVTVNYFEQWLSLTPQSDNWEAMAFPSSLFRVLMGMKEFQNLLVDRFLVYMGDFLHPRYLARYVDSLASVIEYEFPYTYSLYEDYRANDHADWYEEVELIKNYPSKRNWLNAISMQKYLGAGSLFHLQINNPFEEDLPYRLVFNEVPMVHTSFEGYFYKNRTIDIKAEKKDSASSEVYGWYVDQQIGASTISKFYTGTHLTLMVPEDLPLSDMTIRLCTEELEQPLASEAYCVATEGGVVLAGLKENTDVALFDLAGNMLLHKNGFRYEEQFLSIPKGCYLMKINQRWRKLLVP